MSQYDYITLVSDTDWKLVAIVPNSAPKSPKDQPIPVVPEIITTSPQRSMNFIENTQISFSPNMQMETIPSIRLTARSNRRLMRSGNRGSERVVVQR
jgi:hypothetical protein